jgi:hypothetical protein
MRTGPGGRVLYHHLPGQTGPKGKVAHLDREGSERVVRADAGGEGSESNWGRECRSRRGSRVRRFREQMRSTRAHLFCIYSRHDGYGVYAMDGHATIHNDMYK